MLWSSGLLFLQETTLLTKELFTATNFWGLIVVVRGFVKKLLLNEVIDMILGCNSDEQTDQSYSVFLVCGKWENLKTPVL